jgi:tetratricopeptide (TPR) repeat protein
MSFNKIKAMRNAERYLTQGKIQAAISEYKQVVENDKKDINSLNMLGDLYVNSKNNREAVKCYQAVAEFYSTQGFSKKAIAIYNKIYRIEPESMEVATKLANLYHVRGSLAEARKHYSQIAKRYEQKGLKLEALGIWEKIAEMSPDDTEIYIKIADANWEENRREEAARAYNEAGNRLFKKGSYQEAVIAYSRVLEVNSEDLKALKGFVASQIKLGLPEEAAKVLVRVLDNQPYHQELNYLLMDCYFDMGDAPAAEAVITKLVEREPANYPKLLELVSVYLEDDNLDSASRILSMTSEHLLVGGESEKLKENLDEILARNPEHVPTLRMLSRYYGWQRDEQNLQETLKQLADAARLSAIPDEERNALAQYLLMVPHDTERSNRLKEINLSLGITEDYSEEEVQPANSEEVPTFESYAVLSDSNDSNSVRDLEWDDNQVSGNDEELETPVEAEILPENEVTEEFEPVPVEMVETDQIREDEVQSELNSEIVNESTLSAAEEVRIDDELESVKFYIDQGYQGLAEKSLSELESEFGNRKEFIELRERLANRNQAQVDVTEGSEEFAIGKPVEEVVEEAETEEAVSEQQEAGQIQTENYPQRADEAKHFVEPAYESNSGEDVSVNGFKGGIENSENAETTDSEVSVDENKAVTDSPAIDSDREVSDPDQEEVQSDSSQQEETQSIDVQKTKEEISPNESDDALATDIEKDVSREDYSNSFDDLKDELGLNSHEKSVDDNYEEHYQHAVVYQEMGMLDEAIREFQDAVNIIDANDETHRFLNCCTLIGHCFIQKGMPKLAVTWFERAFETADLKNEEKLGLHYELANAFDLSGDKEKAIEQFELIYSLDIDYRDVSERLQELSKDILTTA